MENRNKQFELKRKELFEKFHALKIDTGFYFKWNKIILFGIQFIIIIMLVGINVIWEFPRLSSFSNDKLGDVGKKRSKWNQEITHGLYCIHYDF